MANEVTTASTRRVQVHRPEPRTPMAEKRKRFLEVLAASANAERAAAMAGAPVASFYQLRQRDAGFAAAWGTALDDAYARLEAAVLARAMGEGSAAAEGKAPDDGSAGGDGGAPSIVRTLDPRLALDLLKRRDATTRRGAGGMPGSTCKVVPIEEVERALLARLDALARRAGAA